MRAYSATIQLLAISVLHLAGSPAYADEAYNECGGFGGHYGPFDYRSASQDQRELVEKYHFTPRVENLIGGSTGMTPGADLEYTLRAFPNHPRALMSVIKLGEKQKREKPREMSYTVACWLERAERFRPDDGMVKAVHGIYLIRSGQPGKGAEKLQAALELSGDNANIYYNLGLAYFELKQFEKSLECAQRAYALGFPLPGLREKLKREGKWREMEATSR